MKQSSEKYHSIVGTTVLSCAVIIGLSFVVYPYAPGSLLMSVLGLSAYVIPVLLAVHGLLIIQTVRPRSVVLAVLLVSLRVVSLSLLGGCVDIVTGFPATEENIWLFGGSLGRVPFMATRFISNVHMRSLVTLLLSVLVVALAFSRPLLYLLHHLVEFVKRSLGHDNADHVIPYQTKPQLKVREECNSKFPSTSKIQPQKYPNAVLNSVIIEKSGLTPLSNLPDEPIPLEVLPDSPMGAIKAEHDFNPLRESLTRMEDTIIEIALSRSKVRIRRVSGMPPRVGVHIVQFNFDPDENNKVLVNRLLSVADDLGIALGRAPVSIHMAEHIVVEVPLTDAERSYVPIKPLLQGAIATSDGILYYLLGVDTQGSWYQLPVKKCIHVLVGGQTQSGKTVMLHTLIFGFIFRYRPSEVKIALYDHKMEEFMCYRNLPHLWAPVATNTREFDMLLESLEKEFQRRKLVRSTDRRAVFPLLVVIMDEFRGLSTDRLVTLISECRSLSMVFILATQYPRSDIISTPIKANLVTGICFKTRDSQASRLVIGEAGGERLMGNGDCLVHSPLALDRIQGAYCSMDDIDALEAYLEDHAKHG
jgi:hypothetical protein